MRALVYSRVSTDAQERDGTSLDTQERACMEHAQANGWQVLERIRDTASGFTLDRPGVERVRHLLRQGTVDVVIAYAVDRVSRNQNHIGVLFDEVEQAGARLEFVTERFEDTAIGRFILAARAFIAEVEREKIAERTTRGKIERARSGRLPQATGKGIYGYRYNRETGKREIEAFQAAVVQRVFSDFLQGGPIVAIANRLNEAGVATFTGSKWHPATIYHLLRNETYTGRTIYRRTAARQARDPRTGRRRRKVERRDAAEWIEIEGATPTIVDKGVFNAVQDLLDDPERRRRGRRLHDYALSGHIQCLRCGKAMVGQTLQRAYRYYRCRRAFAGLKDDRCDTTYVRADDLESVTRQEVARVLADPGLIAAEYKRWRLATEGVADTTDLQRQLRNVDAQRLRLAKLYQIGEIDDDYLKAESSVLRARRKTIEAQVERQRPPMPDLSLEGLEQACERVRAWVQQATGDDLALIADALQIRVRAEKGRAELTGVIPEYAPQCSDADVRSMVIN